MDAKRFGAFISERRKEHHMTQADLAGKVGVTDKAVSRWERGLGFPDIQTLEPLAQALGITVLELMRSEKKETEEQDQQPEERRYTQGEVAEMLQNAGDISRQQKKQDRNANVIAGIVLAAITVIVWMTKLASLGGALVIGGIFSRISTMKRAEKSTVLRRFFRLDSCWRWHSMSGEIG